MYLDGLQIDRIWTLKLRLQLPESPNGRTAIICRHEDPSCITSKICEDTPHPILLPSAEMRLRITTSLQHTCTRKCILKP